MCSRNWLKNVLWFCFRTCSKHSVPVTSGFSNYFIWLLHKTSCLLHNFSQITPFTSFNLYCPNSHHLYYIFFFQPCALTRVSASISFYLVYNFLVFLLSSPDLQIQVSFTLHSSYNIELIKEKNTYTHGEPAPWPEKTVKKFISKVKTERNGAVMQGFKVL